jgi:hypothetical protein
MTDNVIEKVVDTANVAEGNGGLLNPSQQDVFIDYMWDSTVLGREVRKHRMRSNEDEIDRIGVGERIAKLATEAVDTGVNAAVQFTKISITTKKIRLDWEISTETLEDNIEGTDLADHIARMLATQFGNDLEDLAINGDDDSADPLLKSFDGWKKLALAGATVVNHGGANLDRSAFNKALKAMPRKFMQRRGELSFYTGSNVIQDYLFSLTDLATTPENIAEQMIRTGPVRTEGGAGFVTAYAFGLPVKEVPLFDETLDGTYSGSTGDHGYMELTFPKNRIWAIKRDIVVYKEFKPKKDTTEWTIFCRTGVQWENLDALVVVSNVKVAS